jgi:hypothetical protein
MSEEGQLGANSISASTESSAPINTSSETTERMLPQSKVDELVGHVRKETRDKVRSEYEQQRASASAPAQQSSMGGMLQMSQDQLKSLVDEAASTAVSRESQRFQEATQKQAEEQYIQDALNTFAGKISGANEKYSDFEDKVGKLDVLNKAPHLIPLINEVDKDVAPDVLYAIANNPIWAHQLNTLRKEMGHEVAQMQMSQLVNSIKQNQEAFNAKRTNEPLSHVKSSTTATDSGQLTVSDYRKMKFLRG